MREIRIYIWNFFVTCLIFVQIIYGVCKDARKLYSRRSAWETVKPSIFGLAWRMSIRQKHESVCQVEHKHKKQHLERVRTNLFSVQSFLKIWNQSKTLDRKK